MKILFVLDYVDFPTAVNPQLAARLAGQLVNMGHSASLLRLWDGCTPPPPPPEGVQVQDLAFADEHQMNLDLENGRKIGSPAPVRVARLLTHPAAAAAAFRQLILHKNRRQTACTKAIERLCRGAHYDAVVAVCAPYHTAWALADADIPAKKATWQMDPYSANREYTPYGGAQKELAMYARIDRAFITKLMEPDYESGPLAPAKPKTQVLEFPCLCPLPPAPAQSHTGLQCVFAGSLHPEIRQPYALLSLFEKLADVPGLQLVMLGGGWENFPADAPDACRKALGQRLTIAGQVPPQQARSAMAGADMLINLGNTVTNQLPSKIFEYFSSGKPILNLCANPSDPALRYFARYPLALTLFANDASAPEKLRCWLTETAGKRLDFAQSATLFAENTPAAVAKELLRGLQ